MKRSVIARFFVISGAYLLAGAAAGDSGTGGSVPESTRPARQLATSFTGFAGSEENAASLVNGLRSGGLVTLAAPASTGAGESLSFVPPTRPMGWGNVRHALTLAQRELAAQGIDNPTPAELQAALTGGTITTATGQTATLPGTLVLRSQGMGWGRIAHVVGVPLGNNAAPAGQGFAVGTVRSYRAGAITNPTGDILRSAHWRGDGRASARTDAVGATPAASRIGNAMPAAAATVAPGPHAAGEFGRAVKTGHRQGR